MSGPTPADKALVRVQRTTGGMVVVAVVASVLVLFVALATLAISLLALHDADRIPIRATRDVLCASIGANPPAVGRKALKALHLPADYCEGFQLPTPPGL